VDNNSTDNTQSIISNFCSQHNNARSITEYKQGLSHARNAGFQSSRTEWIAYIDDDAKLSSDYVEELLRTIIEFDFDCIGGQYIPWYKYGKPKWYLDSYGSNGKLLAQTGLLDFGYASGGVLSIKKFVLEQFNGFSDRLGMHGEKIAYGEEIHLQDAMRANGYKIGFNPDLIIHHLVSISKMTPIWFIKRGFAEGRDYWSIHEVQVTNTILFKLLYRIFYNFTIKGIRNFMRLFRKDYYWQNWVIDVIGTTSTLIGQFGNGLRLRLTSNS
jgi:glycosyltransferase involved in cell wall biosynthesis